jgi:hypothetical protein
MSWVTWGSHRSAESRRNSSVSGLASNQLTPTRRKLPPSPRRAQGAGDVPSFSDDEKSEHGSSDHPPQSTFVWSEGYQGRDLPTRPEGAESVRTGRRRASEAPSMGVVSEEDDEGPLSRPRQLQSSLPISSSESSTSSRRGSDFLSPTPIRLSHSPFRRGSQPLQALNSKSIEGTDQEPGSPGTPRTPSRSMAMDRNRDVSPTRRISFNVPSDPSRRESETHPIPRKLSFSVPSFLHSIGKQDGSTAIEPFETPSRELTPVKDSTAGSFQLDEPLRRRASIGLESFVSWHEGRANLVEILRELQQVAQGTISVNGELSVLSAMTMLTSWQFVGRDHC